MKTFIKFIIKTLLFFIVLFILLLLSMCIKYEPENYYGIVEKVDSYPRNLIISTSGIYFNYKKFSKETVLKKIEVSYLSLGRDILNENNDSIAIRIRTITENTPYSSMSFLYRGQKYYISVHQKCKTNNLSANEKITLYIQFYRDIKQPYQNKYPYAIITKINKLCYTITVTIL